MRRLIDVVQLLENYLYGHVGIIPSEVSTGCAEDQDNEKIRILYSKLYHIQNGISGNFTEYCSNSCLFRSI